MSEVKIKINQPRGSYLAHLLARGFAFLIGWKIKGTLPPGKKFVLVCAPHTSNWDFLILKIAMGIYRLKVHWMGKDSLFKPPFGFIMRYLGGLAIERNHKHGVVGQVADAFKKAEHLVVAVPPSGTRSKQPYWRSGFYWISVEAQVPLLLGYVDYEKKEAAIAESFLPTGNVKQDMDRIRAFYEGKKGRHPAAVIRLRDEDA